MQNQATSNSEHSNPANWHYTFYYAPKDPNVVVAKRWGWEYGATLNFARLESYLLLATPAIVGTAILVCVLLFGR
jgi:uncharacterized membrane protein